MRPRDGAALAPLGERNADSIYLSAPGTPAPDERADDAFLEHERLPRRGEPPAPRLEGGKADAAARYVDEETERLREADGVQMATVAMPPTPIVGDARVTFGEVRQPEDGVSILGALKQSEHGSGPVLRPWARDSATVDAGASRGARGRLGSAGQPTLFMLVSGRIGAREMLGMARRHSDRRKWGVRAAGAGLMGLRFACTLSFLPALAGYAPQTRRSILPLPSPCCQLS